MKACGSEVRINCTFTAICFPPVAECETQSALISCRYTRL